MVCGDIVWIGEVVGGIGVLEFVSVGIGVCLFGCWRTGVGLLDDMLD